MLTIGGLREPTPATTINYDGDLFPYHENGSSSSDEYEDDSGSQSDEED